MVIYSVNWEVRGVGLQGGGPLLPPLPAVSSASAIAYSARGDWLYWSDGEAGRVARVRRDGGARALLAPAAARAPPPAPPPAQDWVAGLAVDWVGDNVFWGDALRRTVVAARGDGSRRLAVAAAAAPLTALAVDAARGWLFLCAAGELRRARLDGSDLATVRNATAIVDIALDLQNEQIYWIEGWEGQLMAAAYDGSGARAVGRLPRPQAIAVHRGHLYWLDR